MKVRYLLGLILILFVWTYVCRWYHCRYDTPSVLSDTIFIEKKVEVKDTTPDIKNEKVTGQISIPVHSNSPHIGKNKHDSTCLSGQKSDDKRKTDDSIRLEIIQRKYTDDSTYTAYVSGLKYGTYPRLDSIITKRRIIERTVTNTIRGKQSRWHVGVTAGYGYGFRSRTFEPFVGIGVQYSIW